MITWHARWDEERQRWVLCQRLAEHDRPVVVYASRAQCEAEAERMNRLERETDQRIRPKGNLFGYYP